jgi:hypothetical protein
MAFNCARQVQERRYFLPLEPTGAKQKKKGEQKNKKEKKKMRDEKKVGAATTPPLSLMSSCMRTSEI